MGRRPKKPGAVTRLRERTKPSGKTYYYYDAGGKPRKEVPLGSDYGLAIMRYAELERDRNADNLSEKVVTLRYVSTQYFLDVVPKKASSSQKKDAQYLVKLMEFFDDPPGPMDSIEPHHVYQYMQWRAGAPVSANREKALLSHMWNYARKMGYTKLANPCAGINGHPESGRDVYIEDDLYLLVYQHADIGLQEAMDLAYLTGQRPGDVLAMDERDIRDGMLHLRQGKTKVKRRIVIEGELAVLLDRIKARKAGFKVRPTRLIVSATGMVMSKHMLRDRFDLAREAAGIEKAAFQLRDLRAKAGSDKSESTGDILKVRDQLGHTTVAMTEHYIRNRRGKKVTPTK